MNDQKTFEETYASYPFPRLVEFGLALSGLLVRVRDRRVQTREHTSQGAVLAR